VSQSASQASAAGGISSVNFNLDATYCGFFPALVAIRATSNCWLTALQSCPDLVTAIGGNGSNIRAFMEGLATDNNLRLDILQMPPGSILVAWNGTTPRRLTGGSLDFAHRLSIYLRAAEQNSTATYADLFWLLVSAVPTGAPSWESLLHFQIDPDCYAKPPDHRRESLSRPDRICPPAIGNRSA
jgi:hypothetical protein